MNKSHEDHMDVLKNNVFQVEKVWPQFKLLLSDILRMSKDVDSSNVIVSIERTLLYGGYSLIAPFFEHSNFISVDCSPPSADERGAYNAWMVDDPRFIKVKSNHRASIEDTGFDDSLADLVMVPNLVHHVADQDALFSELYRILKPGGKLYIFEALVRELHQIPDDYLRYTPYGLRHKLLNSGFEIVEEHTEGGPFQVITYCWQQALQYLPEGEREKLENWFHSRHYAELMELDSKFKVNLERKNTSFPMSFSVIAQK